MNTPPLVRMGQTASLNCTANGSTPVTVAWYKGTKVLTAGMSEAVLTLKNITYKDWGEFLCVANNSVGEDEKTVVLRGRQLRLFSILECWYLVCNPPPD